MKISISRSGGFAGLTMPAKTLETADKATQELVHRIACSPKSQSSGNIADGLNYKVSVTYDDGNETSFDLVEPDSDDFFALLKKVNDS